MIVVSPDYRHLRFCHNTVRYFVVGINSFKQILILQLFSYSSGNSIQFSYFDIIPELPYMVLVYSPCLTMRRSIQQSALVVCIHVQHRGYYMSAHVLLNVLNELKKSDKMRGLSSN